jgi:[ribosomal protein S5]-alanine N-acetyltransferase
VTIDARSDPKERLTVARGPSVRIRRKLREDAIDEYAWRRDPEHARFNGVQPFADGFTRFLQAFEYDLVVGHPDREQFAIETSGGAHIGSVMYYNADLSRDTAEFGMAIGDSRYRGQGFGREAAILFVGYLWQNYPFRLLHLHTLEWNERARRSFAAAGFNDVALVQRGAERFVRMEARREWWLLWEMEGRFRLGEQGKLGARIEPASNPAAD